jgi:Family of unknown function (DUF6221)
MPDVDRLVAAIRREIDEDERAALAATPGPWCDFGPHSVGVEQVGIENGHMVCEMQECPEVTHEDRRAADAEHIARQDPARTLRQVAAHREILELHAAETHECRDGTPSVYPADAHLLGKTPGEEWTYYSTEYFEARPCPTLLALAEVYGVQDSDSGKDPNT